MQTRPFPRFGLRRASFVLATLLVFGEIPRGGFAQTPISRGGGAQSGGQTHALPFALLQSASPMPQEAPALQARPYKHPKLSTPLAELARALPQQRGLIPEGQRIAPPTGFSLTTLPKSARDAVRARMMRINNDAEVQVYVELSEVTDENLNALRALGVTVEIVGEPKPDKTKHEVLTYVPTVQGLLPVSMIDQVAALPFVRFIRLPDYGFTNTGSVDTQGDSILMADEVRSQFDLDGTGVKVGVISDGIGGIFAAGCTTCGPTIATPSPITLGDLPDATGTRDANGILTSVSGGIIAQSFPSSSPNLEPPPTEETSGVASEGTAMLEIVHDLAPGAQLYFANAADGTSMSFELAVNFLASKADVVVDDIGFVIPPPTVPPSTALPYDGTSAVSTNTATALNTDSNPIRAYFTAVGNMVLHHYEEPYADSGSNLTLSCPGGPSASGDVHLFQATANTNDLGNLGPYLANPFSIPDGATVIVVLTWNDPFTGSSNDYDMYLYLIESGMATTPLACSVDPQTGTQPPAEGLYYKNNSGGPQQVAIFIQNFNNLAQARTFDMFVRGLYDYPQNLNFDTMAGSVPAQADAGGSPVSVISVGATDAQIDAQGNPPATVIEPYSSQGPTEATPQAPSRIKPDIVATDDVCVTGAGGFGGGPATNCPPSPPTSYTPQVFPGTSAAAPHAAGVAALLLQSAPCLLSSSTINTPATARTNLRNLITSTAVPLPGIFEPIPNNIEGFGLIDAFAAVGKTLPTANAGPDQTVNGTSASGATVTLSGSSADPDNCALTLNWSGACGTATGANPTLTCPLGVNLETLTASNGGATNSPSASTVQITVTNFAISASPSSASVSPGRSATYTLSVNPQYGAFTNAVSLACSNLPARSTCSFSPSSVTPGASGATSNLTISTTAASALFKEPFGQPPVYGLWIGLMVLSLIAFASIRRFARTRARALYVSAGLFGLFLALLAACGGGGGGGGGPTNPGTPAGTYTITIAGTAGSLQNSGTVTLIVQ